MEVLLYNKSKIILIISSVFFSFNAFSQLVDYSLIPYRKADKWGYANADRNIVIVPTYAEVKWFSEGLAAVRVGNKWGYINKTGKLVIPARYTVAKSFRKGFVPTKNKMGADSVIFAGASLVASGYEICINPKGTRLPKCPAIAENSVVENSVPIETIERKKTYSLVNNNGLFDEIVDDYKVGGIEETFYIAQKGGLYGVFNSKFENIVPFEYNRIKKINSSGNLYLQVMKNEMNGIITGDGKNDISAIYNYLVLVKGIDNSDYVIVTKDGKYFVKDLNNRDIIAQGYANITYDDNGGFILTDNSNMRGMYFSDNRIIGPKYTDIKFVNRGSDYMQIETISGKGGFINTAGNEFFED